MLRVGCGLDWRRNNLSALVATIDKSQPLVKDVAATSAGQSGTDFHASTAGQKRSAGAEQQLHPIEPTLTHRCCTNTRRSMSMLRASLRMRCSTYIICGMKRQLGAMALQPCNIDARLEPYECPAVQDVCTHPQQAANPWPHNLQTDGAHLRLQLLNVQLLHRGLHTTAVQTDEYGVRQCWRALPGGKAAPVLLQFHTQTPPWQTHRLPDGRAQTKGTNSRDI